MRLARSIPGALRRYSQPVSPVNHLTSIATATCRAGLLGALLLGHLSAHAGPGASADGVGTGTHKVVVTGDGKRSAYLQSSSSATRTETPVLEVPQSVQTVPRQLIDDLGATRLDDVLLHVSGVAKQNDFGGIWDNYAIRGFAGSENGGMNVLWNGVTSNRGYAPPRDMANVESVDFLKGPVSAAYGSSEPGGTISLVTKKPRFRRAMVVDLSAATHDAYRAAIDSTGPLGKQLAYRLNAAIEQRHSMREHIRSSRRFLAPALSWFPGEETAIHYEAEFLQQAAPMDRGVIAIDGDPGVLPASRFLGEPGDGDMTMSNQNHLLTIEHRIAGHWHLRAGVFHKSGKLDGYSTEASSLHADNSELWRQRRLRDFAWRDNSLQVMVSGRLQTGRIQHEVLAGIDANTLRLDQRMLRANPRSGAPYAIEIHAPIYGQPAPIPSAHTHTSEHQTGIGLFLQDQISLGPHWKLLAGARADSFRSTLREYRAGMTSRQDRNAYSPRLGLIRLISPTLSVYVSGARSFRPNAGSDADGEAFSPETARAGELGLKFQSTGKRIGATLAAFDITKQNVLTIDPDNPGFSVPAGEIRSKGVEFDMNGRLSRFWRVTANLAYTDAAVVRDGRLRAGSRLINIPDTAGSLLAVFEASDARGAPFGAGGGFSYVGARSGDQSGSFQLPAYTTARALAYWQLAPRTTLSLEIHNLFDRRHYASSYDSLWIMPGKARATSLTLKIKL